MKIIATSLKVTAFYIKPLQRQPLQRYCSYLTFKTNIFKVPVMTKITFVLLASIPSEMSILSCSSIYNSYKHSSKKSCR